MSYNEASQSDVEASNLALNTMIYQEITMPADNHTPRICVECGRSDGEVKFYQGRRRCQPCRIARQNWRELHPDAPHLKKRPRQPIVERLLKHRSIDANGCWLWTATIDQGGYGRIVNVKIDGVTQTHFVVHRLVAHLFLGLDLHDRSQIACHRCDVRACFNPDHLFIGTQKDNMIDCVMKGRLRPPKGEKNRGGGKLQIHQIKEIREALLAGESQTSIAKRYGVCQTMISHIYLGKAWKCVPA